MRQVFLGSPLSPDAQQFNVWVREALRELERASYDEIAAVADDFTVSNFTDTRTLNAGTAVLADVANVLCTFINDMKKRGTKRTE